MFRVEEAIPAFRLMGTCGDEMIELTIGEVFNKSLDGSYGAKGVLAICAGEYRVWAQHHIATGELCRFFAGLKQCYDLVRGVAVLVNFERELELKCEFDRLGHVVASGKFQANLSIHNILEFEIMTDQTQVKESLEILQAVNGMFGCE